MDRWVVAIVKDGAELDLAASLSADLSLEAYAPAYRHWRKLAKHVARREGRTRELVVAALLTGYLFVKVNMATNADILRLMEAKGVYGVISNSRGPCFARESDVEGMRAIEASGIHNVKVAASDVRKPVAKVTEEIRERLRALSLVDLVGKMVRLVDGPFTGLSGEVHDVRGGYAHMRINQLSVASPLENVALS